MSQYEPEIVPLDPEGFAEFLTRQLRSIADIQRGISFLDSVALTVQHSPPHELYSGLIVFADGTDWDPGSGEGVYVRTSTPAWVKL